MFFFKKKKPKLKMYDDHIWVSKAMRYQGLYRDCNTYLEEERIVMLIPFFSETMEEIEFIFDHQKRNENTFNISYKLLNSQIVPSDLSHQEVYIASPNWLLENLLRKAELFLELPICFLFPEHYPIPSLETKVLDALNEHKWPNAFGQFYDSLDSKLMSEFGSERILEMLSRLGINKNEVISHNMISKSIRKAQQQLAKKVREEQVVTSETEWFQKNVPS